ncbi:sporulation histidine kinase inhibitor Sda [Niallia sp. NCCP-28]|uniref:sporulation histidine kinase inhibitor Sda n=1 Tax=Niallia sp. NCCP-28 TaxID=2934712 RepID=UPI00208D82DE|nr:sporulation histidine kinase inhibitor Sda [Niallia sp. NCCP-28]GKU83933.1 hypothetical protein NCCP28_33290 [Niallia sp. NCCP-28]
MSSLTKLNDDSLLITYKDACKHQLSSEFLLLLRKEISKRHLMQLIHNSQLKDL